MPGDNGHRQQGQKMFTISKLDFLRQLDEGNVVGEGAWVPVGVNDGIGGLDDNPVLLAAQGQVVRSGVDFPTAGLHKIISM